MYMYALYAEYMYMHVLYRTFIYGVLKGVTVVWMCKVEKIPTNTYTSFCILTFTQLLPQ